MSTIENLLTVAQKRLAELEGEAEHLRALIRLYAGPAQGQNVKKVSAADDSKGHGRGVSQAWRPLGAYLVKNGELHLDDLREFSVQNDLPFTRTQIRNQMHNWKRRGFVESPRTSVFTITPAGIDEMAGPAPSNSNGADHQPAPSPDVENRDEPSISTDRLALLNVHKAPLPGGGT